MTKKILHVIVFLAVAAIVSSAFLGEGDDDVKAMGQLPALMLAAVYLGVMFVTYILPALTDRATTAVLDSGEIVEKDPLHDARAAYARGDYEEAMEVYRSVTSDDPYNRLPWVEIAKIQHDNLEDPDASIETLREALESHEWPVNDAAYFMGRLSEIYLEDKNDQEACITILNQMIELFPETRHSANATHKLNEIMRANEAQA
ncbi:tetratricopeptide repeat protein [Verrucomicrobiaceae bacterium N1E253]|uniref:Tetratricopeptide repeat protein n=1 Tax=Oceaniferula marina TaxID=2748318 RepID=A0A851GJ98_9BACT|nr:tetratricopeptide repeat protein [Oceaniferula marina]NWK55941.1 tetratricopeptide repeat protein [Oceaniferula marina]